MEQEEITCKNCGTIFKGNFCNSCGQRSSIHKITWRHAFHDLTHAMFHVDEGLFHSAKELLRRPGDTIRDYIDGKRVKHFNPLLMLILVGGFCTILYGMFDLRTLFSPIRIHDLEEKSSFLAHKYFALTMFFGCLLLTLGDYLVLLARDRFTFPELFLGNAFICGQVLLFQIVVIPFFLLGRTMGINDYLRWTCIVVILLYIFITKYQFFQASGKAWVTVRIIATITFFLIAGYLISRKILLPLFS